MTQQFHPNTGGRGIEWCDETRNVTGGCMHDCKWIMPDGTIVECYSKTSAERGVAKAGYPHGFEHHYWRPQNLRPLTAGADPRLIFCDSMSDMFEANVPANHVVQILDAMRESPHHTYQCRPGRSPIR